MLRKQGVQEIHQNARYYAARRNGMPVINSIAKAIHNIGEFNIQPVCLRQCVIYFFKIHKIKVGAFYFLRNELFYV